MKLIFNKNNQSQISVRQEINGRDQDFSYVEMVKALIESPKMEDPVISGSFTEAEVKSIRRMVDFINTAVSSVEHT